MNKTELASYLVNLIAIMESKEDASIHRGQTLIKEYEKHYAMLRDMLGKEHEDEARKSQFERSRLDKAGTDLTRREPEGSGSARSGHPSLDPTLSGSRV